MCISVLVLRAFDFLSRCDYSFCMSKSLRLRLLVALLAAVALLVLTGLALGVPGVGAPGALTPAAPDYALAPGAAMVAVSYTHLTLPPDGLV